MCTHNICFHGEIRKFTIIILLKNLAFVNNVEPASLVPQSIISLRMLLSLHDIIKYLNNFLVISVGSIIYKSKEEIFPIKCYQGMRSV